MYLKRSHEIAYSPANLRQLIQDRLLSVSEFADAYDLNYRTLYNWTLDLDNPNHRQMPLKIWFQILDRVSRDLNSLEKL